MSATVHRLPEPLDPEEHEILTVAEFAARVKRTPKAIYKRIRLKQLPAGCLKRVLGHYAIDWTVFKRSIEALN
jgi:hypothetical protein